MDLSVDCPNCKATLHIPDRLLGKTVKCPKCQVSFATEREESGFEVVEDDEPRPRRRPGESGPKKRGASPLPPPPKARHEENFDDDGEFDEGDDRPQRRGNRRTAARQAVEAPAICMMVLGGIGFLTLFGGILLHYTRPNPELQQMRRQAEPGMYVLGTICAFTLLTFWPIIVAYGGYKMKNLQNYSSVMIAIFVSMAPCNLGCFGGIPLGIWALMVMNRPEVRKAFAS